MALVATSFAACGSPSFFVRPQTEPAPTNSAATVDATLTEADVDAVLSEIARVRGHTPKSKIPVRIADDAEFAELFRSMSTQLIEPGGHPVLRGTELFDAFYDPTSKAIVVKKRNVVAPKLLRTLAHELEHALQHQLFAWQDGDDVTTNARLAYAALREGDAVVTARAVEAAHRHHSVRRAIRSLREVIPDEDTKEVVADVEEREVLGFLYKRGPAFAAALWEVGGFALLDKALREPPRTTTEVLHPERYVQGYQPWNVEHVDLGSNTRNDSIGEFSLARILAEHGAAREDAFALAEGWRGDAFSKREGAEVWTIVTTNAASTGEILRGLGGEVRIRGNVVSFARRTSDDAHFAELGLQRASSEGPKMPPSPMGTVTIPKAQPWLLARIPATSVRHGDVFELPNYGLRIPVLERAKAAPLPKYALLNLQGEECSASIQASVFYPKEAKLAALVTEMDEKTTAAFGAWTKVERDVVTPMGAGHEVVYTAKEHVVRAIMFRACRNTTTFIIMTEASTPRAKAEVERWVSGIDVGGLESSAFCKEVNADSLPD